MKPLPRPALFSRRRAGGRHAGGPDFGDMGTAIGLEYSLDQSALPPPPVVVQPPAGAAIAPPTGWRGWLAKRRGN